MITPAPNQADVLARYLQSHRPPMVWRDLNPMPSVWSRS